MGGAQDGGGGGEDDHGPFGGEGLGLFGGTVGGALTNLLGGSWGGRDDDEDPSAAPGTSPRRKRGTSPNHRRAFSSVGNGGGDGGGSGPFSWLNPTPAVSPGAARSSAAVRNAGGSVSPPRERGGGRGGFTLAAFPLSPFGNLSGNSSAPGGRNADRPRPPSPARSPLVAPAEEVGARLGRQASPGVNRRRMTIGGSSGGSDDWSPKRRPERAVVSPAATTAVTAAPTLDDGWGSSTTAVSRGRENPAQQKATKAEIVESGGRRGDAAWLAKSEEAWAAVPVESKRECLRNVLLAIAARFPDVGYCQVSSSFGRRCKA